jgi:hypothetical protein
MVATLTDPSVDAALAIFAAPLAPFLDEMSAALVAAAGEAPAKPLLGCMLGREVVINQDGHAVPSFAFPESAVLALSRVVRYAEWRARPAGGPVHFDDVDRESARQAVDALLPTLSPGQDTWLEQPSVARLLAAYGIPVVAPGETRPPSSQAGVGIEVALDPLFGHLVAVGPAGGVRPPAGERQFRTLPLSDRDARDLAGAVGAAPHPEGGGGPGPFDSHAVVDLLLRVSQLVEDVPEVAELRLDSLVASHGRATALAAAARLAPWRPGPEPALRRLR